MGKGREQRVETAVARRPPLARAEVIDKATRMRFENEIDAALKRRPPNEGKLAGALRAVAPYSSSVRNALAEALSVMVRRGSFKRELYTAAVRALADAGDKRVGPLLRAALGGEDAGSSATLSAACFCIDPSISPALTKLAASRQSHMAFGAEIARVVRGESNGVHLGSLAPMIKESHRIALCTEMMVPLARAKPVSRAIAPALKVLRGAERHLGRWLVMGEVAAKSGDPLPLDEAREKSKVGPSSARAAWSLVAWALSEATHAESLQVQVPDTRPTVELIARLSDRPSADRDTTFLFRLAGAKAMQCRLMLEGCVKALPLADEVAIRAALYLARDHGRDDLRQALVDAAHGDGAGARREELRGVSTAALWDLGLADVASSLAEELAASKSIGNVAWGALIRAAAVFRHRANQEGHLAPLAGQDGSRGPVLAALPTTSSPLDGARESGEKLNGAGPSSGSASAPFGPFASPDLLHETSLRWIQWGWLE